MWIRTDSKNPPPGKMFGQWLKKTNSWLNCMRESLLNKKPWEATDTVLLRILFLCFLDKDSRRRFLWNDV
jgi:hypothetical protein